MAWLLSLALLFAAGWAAAQTHQQIDAGTIIGFDFGNRPIHLEYSRLTSQGLKQSYTMVISQKNFYPLRMNVHRQGTNGACFFQVESGFFPDGDITFEANQVGGIHLEPQQSFVIMSEKTPSGGFMLARVGTPSRPAARFVCTARITADMSAAMIEFHMGDMLRVNGQPLRPE